jgi:serine/threonine protein kinase
MYMSPEVLMDSMKIETSTKCDVYSFGIIMYEVFFERVPYESDYDFSIIALGTKVVNGMRPSIPEDALKGLSEAEQVYLELMQRCWAENVDQRPNFGEIYIIFTETLVNTK